MITKSIIHASTVSGLRTRFVPKSRIGQGLISIAPWVDIILIAIFFIIMNNHYILQPGVSIELPRTEVLEGSSSTLVAILKSVESIQGNRAEEILFFNDERFVVRNDQQMNQFRDRLQNIHPNRAEDGLVLFADASISHGTVTRIMNLARSAEPIRRVTLAIDRNGANTETRPGNKE